MAVMKTSFDEDILNIPLNDIQVIHLFLEYCTPPWERRCSIVGWFELYFIPGQGAGSNRAVSVG
jgi:hypothetical protein